MLLLPGHTAGTLRLTLSSLTLATALFPMSKLNLLPQITKLSRLKSVPADPQRRVSRLSPTDLRVLTPISKSCFTLAQRMMRWTATPHTMCSWLTQNGGSALPQVCPSTRRRITIFRIPTGESPRSATGGSPFHTPVSISQTLTVCLWTTLRVLVQTGS